MRSRSSQSRGDKVALGDVVRQVKDKVADPQGSGVTHYLPGGGISAETLTVGGWQPVDDGVMGPAFHMKFSPGHTLYKSRVPHGVGVADRVGICANTTYVLEPVDTKRLLPELLPYFLVTDDFQKFEDRNNRGSTNLFLNFSDIARYDFFLPPLEEQRRILKVFKATESLVNATEVLRKAISALSMRWRRNILAELDAPVCKLSDVCTLRGGSGFKVKYQGQATGELPFIKVSDMNLMGNEKFILSAQNYISVEQAGEMKVNIMPQGAVVFAKVGAALLQNRRRVLTRETCIDNNMMAAIPNSKKIISLFLYLLFLDIDFRELVHEGVIPSVNQTRLGRVPVRVPDLKAQERLIQEWQNSEDAKEATSIRASKVKNFKAIVLRRSLA